MQVAANEDSTEFSQAQKVLKQQFLNLFRNECLKYRFEVNKRIQYNLIYARGGVEYQVSITKTQNSR